MKINNFRGDLTDSSAKKEALVDLTAMVCASVFWVKPMYRLGHPYFILFTLFKKTVVGSIIQKSFFIYFILEK